MNSLMLETRCKIGCLLDLVFGGLGGGGASLRHSLGETSDATTAA